MQLKQSPRTNTIHVGIERFRELTRLAIEVSYHGKRPISPPEFNRYLIDNFGEMARDKMLADIQAASKPPAEQQ